MDLNELFVFVRVVQVGSIRGAAEALGMPKSTVSRKLLDLEERLDVRLLQRTTRKLALTDVGRMYYDHGVRIVTEVENAERAVRSQHETPRGLLRVTTPLNLAFVAPLFSDYLQRYPEVRLELAANARVVDLIEERFDVGIRAGRLEDSSLIAKLLGTIEWILVASTTYTKKRGRPKAPADLKKHDLLLFGNDPTLVLTSNGRSEAIASTPRLLVGDMDVLGSALQAHLGIAVVPRFLCEEALRARRIERVLPSWSAPSTPVQLVYPSTRHLSPTVRSFIDHMQERVQFSALGFPPRFVPPRVPASRAAARRASA
ncbi:MAG: LysR family transcriptional regulator [Deltaproteobacteria bacterium]|nr:LysR family transcriptional regulator [Deltaproteobacteria bacterium]